MTRAGQKRGGGGAGGGGGGLLEAMHRLDTVLPSPASLYSSSPCCLRLPAEI